MSSSAAADLTGIAAHCYYGMGLLTALHDQYPNEPIILNECAPGIIPYSASEVVIDAADNWVSSMKLWTLATDPSGGPVQPPNTGCTGCYGLLTVSEKTHTFTRNRSYYQFAQATRFIQPGAVRIQSTRRVSDLATARPYGVTSGVDDAAFLNRNGTRVVLAYNNTATRKTIAIAWHRKYLSYTLAPAATVTFTWR